VQATVRDDDDGDYDDVGGRGGSAVAPRWQQHVSPEPRLVYDATDEFAAAADEAVDAIIGGGGDARSRGMAAPERYGDMGGGTGLVLSTSSGSGGSVSPSPVGEGVVGSQGGRSVRSNRSNRSNRSRTKGGNPPHMSPTAGVQLQRIPAATS
jgi:hypothetical protein